VDLNWLRETIGNRPWILTLDNHYLNGGLGERILSAAAECGLAGKVKAKRFGLDRTPLCGTYDEVLKAHRMDAHSLAEDIKKTLGERGEFRPEKEAVTAVAESDIG
jgi:transketolase